MVIIGLSILGWLTFPWPLRMVRYLGTQPEGKIWHSELDKQKHLYQSKRGIYFLGDSHMEQCEWSELFPGFPVFNRGIPGETTAMLLKRLPGLIPDSSLVFLQIGVNDLLSGQEVEKVRQNYSQVLNLLKTEGCLVVPTLVFFSTYQLEANQKIAELNGHLENDWKKAGIQYLDINSEIAPERQLKMAYSWDGLHLNAEGYRIWSNKIKPVVSQFALAPGCR